jgi:hypothetical protein
LEEITNIFDALEIEADAEHTMIEPTETTPPPKARPNVVFEEERSGEKAIWLSTYPLSFFLSVGSPFHGLQLGFSNRHPSCKELTILEKIGTEVCIILSQLP